MFGRPGFKTILKALSSKWEQQRDMMIESGDKIIQAMEKSTMEAGENTGAKTPPNGEIVAKTCFGQLLQNYDREAFKNYVFKCACQQFLNFSIKAVSCKLKTIRLF